MIYRDLIKKYRQYYRYWKRPAIYSLTITFGISTIPISAEVTCLAIVLDSELKYVNQINMIKILSGRCFYRLRQLRTIRHTIIVLLMQLRYYSMRLSPVALTTATPSSFKPPLCICILCRHSLMLSQRWSYRRGNTTILCK